MKTDLNIETEIKVINMKKRCVCFTAFLQIITILLTACGSNDVVRKEYKVEKGTITVDFTEEKGNIKPMHCVNNGPIDASDGVSNSAKFREAGIPYARLHDSAFEERYGGDHSVDVHRIFRNFDADETNPASYDFTATDAYLAAITETGAEPFYRLGAAIEHNEKEGTYPPGNGEHSDFEKWARVCEHIILHYNEGWANGFHYNITYWEIWNEPDLVKADGSSSTWQGTPEQFIDLFVTAITHLKREFPNIKIGGPAVSSAKIVKSGLCTAIFDKLKETETPLDFFSFHGYHNNPYSYDTDIETVKKQLERVGFADTEIILNEWNYVRGWGDEEQRYSEKVIKTLKGASFTLSSMCVAQSSDLDMFMYYDARPCRWNGLFDTDTLSPLKGYYVFDMFNKLYTLGKEVSVKNEARNIYACAAKGNDSYALVFSYFNDTDEHWQDTLKDVTVCLQGLPAGKTAKVYLLDDENDNVLVRTELIENNEIKLTFKLFDSVLITIDD